MTEIKRHETIDNLIDTIKECMKAVMPENDALLAEDVATEVAVRVSKTWGGNMVYFPKDLNYEITERNLQIYRDFDGTNHRHLVQKYNLSLQAIYQIIKRVREHERKRNQFDLFH